jgi:hypothetical protein
MKTKAVITLNELCRAFHVETIDDFQERVTMNGDRTYGCVYRDALAEGASEEDAEKRALDAESEELGEACDRYRSAVLSVAEKLFKEHKLSLTEMKRDRFRFRVTPDETWRDAAREIIQTINGVGMFRFESVREFCASGPWTPKEAVLGHLHWIADWPDVYEGTKARSMVDRALRY